MAGTPHPAHDFVQDQQYAVLVADGADLLEVFAYRRHGAGGCAYDRFGDESGDCIATEFHDF
jgi:hypothetical protein